MKAVTIAALIAIRKMAQPAITAIPVMYTMIPCTVRPANCVTIVQAVSAYPADSVDTMCFCAAVAVSIVPNVFLCVRNASLPAANATRNSAQIATPVITASECAVTAVCAKNAQTCAKVVTNIAVNANRCALTAGCANSAPQPYAKIVANIAQTASKCAVTAICANIV